MRDELLYRLQNSFPLTKYPFEELSKELNCGEDEVINLVKRLKDEKVIRQISAIFDTKRLGYHSSLVAFKIDEKSINSAVKVINSHPGVSHNYLRNHSFNIWFTIAVPPTSRFGLNGTINLLKHLSKARESIVLPTIKMFKIAVKLDTTGRESRKEKLQKREYREIEMEKKHYALIAEVQKDIEITREPFYKSIKKLNMDYGEFFDTLNELKDSGVMRRFATILNHRRAGFRANAMSVWSVSEDRAEEIGEKIAEFRAVSHCYLRPKYPSWPYNLFAMVHSKDYETCDRIIDEIAHEVGIYSYDKLYSTKEFKKQRIRYFDSAFEEWEIEHSDGRFQF
jgi:DNA-binding Lrp family transcriptional regulator